MKVNIIPFIVFSSLLIPLPTKAQEFVQETSYSLRDCGYVSYMITSDGRCIDLSYLGGGSSSPGSQYAGGNLEARFFQTLKKLGVAISYKNCEKREALAYYNSGSNQMVFCQNNKSLNDKKTYMATLAHESWHVVQDCMTGLKDGSIQPVSMSNPGLLKNMIKSLNSSDLDNLGLYDSEDLPYEVEAFAMEKHPKIVLDGLNACASSSLAKR